MGSILEHDEERLGWVAEWMEVVERAEWRELCAEYDRLFQTSPTRDIYPDIERCGG